MTTPSGDDILRFSRDFQPSIPFSPTLELEVQLFHSSTLQIVKGIFKGHSL